MFEVIPTSSLWMGAFLLAKGAMLINIVPQPKGKALFLFNADPNWVTEYLKENPKIEVHNYRDSMFILKDKLGELNLLKREGDINV